MVHPSYTASQVAAELARCSITSTVLEAASGVIALLIVSLTGQLWNVGIHRVFNQTSEQFTGRLARRSAVCEHLGSGAHWKRHSFTTGCTSTSLTQRASK
jgi:hypothetical protein